jgi:Fe-S cluster assembly protein SufD
VRATFGELVNNQFVFANGHYSPELSSLRALPEGTTVRSLAEALSAHRGAVEPYLARYASYQDHAFVAFNTAFMLDGAFVSIPKGKVVQEPIHLPFISTARREAAMSHPAGAPSPQQQLHLALHRAGRRPRPERGQLGAG